MPWLQSPLKMARRPEKFVSDDRRVITRFLEFGNPNRERWILQRVLRLDDDTVANQLTLIRREFHARHRDLDHALRTSFERVAHHLDDPDALSDQRKRLIGACFTLEYAFESAALFNPSMVPHPDQSNTPDGCMRFLMSLRATGEGHISSIVFRKGLIQTDGRIDLDDPPRYAFTATPEPDGLYKKDLFRRKLFEMGDWESVADPILAPLPPWFTRQQLEQAIAAYACPEDQAPMYEDICADMRWLTEANYTLKFPLDAYPSEMVIFPATEVESQGMEDLRLVQFTDENGVCTYYGTYTAYDGKRILPMLLETTDFRTFHVSTLNGKWAQNKGMAIFPRKIGGQFMSIARHDGESLYLLTSDAVHFWNQSIPLQQPVEPWEIVQIGNSGSPIETEHGWILLTHGVGPMRRYCLGAVLLDLDDPAKVLGRLRRPLLVPDEEEREGYVPNVVYSCGPMLHGDNLIIPYAMSDVATKFATIPAQQLVDQLLDDGP